MKLIIKNIKNCSWYFIPAGAVFLFTAILILVNSKADTHLWINQFHSEFFDDFFTIATGAGTGVSIGICVIILVFIRYGHALCSLFGYAIAVGVVQLFKHVLLHNMYRPVRYFEELGIELYQVEGIEQKTLKSFPSGHTTEIFFVCTYLAMVIGNKFPNILLLILAVLVGFSRVYLSQHFLEDVLGGAVLGTFFALVSYSLSTVWQQKRPWMNDRLIRK